MRSLRVRKTARREVEAAFEWYRHHSPTAAIRFLGAVDDALIGIRERPDTFPIVAGTLRRALLRRFPYAIYVNATGQILDMGGINSWIAKYEYESAVKAMLTSLVRYAQCKGTVIKRSVVNNDIVESLGQFIQLRYNRGTHVADARELAAQDADFHAQQYHVIHLTHSQGNMLVAQALQELPAREGRPLQQGLCTAQLTMASPIPRSLIPLDQYHLKGFTVPHDILLQIHLPNDFPRYPTDKSLALDTLLTKFAKADSIRVLAKYGAAIHNVDSSYFIYPPNKAHVTAMLDTLSDECTAGSIVTTPSELTVPYNGTVKVGVSVRNRNDRELVGRQFSGGDGLHWGIGLDSLVHGLAPTTGGAATGSLTAFGRNMGQMTVTVVPAHFAGTIVEHRQTQWRFLVGFSNSFTPVPPPPGVPGWDGTPGGCTATITMTADENWTTYIASCTRYYTLEVPPGAMPGGTRLRVLLADYPDGDYPAGGAGDIVPEGGISGQELSGYRCGPGYCLRQAIIQTVANGGGYVITSDTLCFSDNCGGASRRARKAFDQSQKGPQPLPSTPQKRSTSLVRPPE